MRLRRRMTMAEFWACYHAADPNSYIPYEDVNLADLGSNPEQILMEKESFFRLSDEAKDIVRIIYNSPSEMAELINTPEIVKAMRKKIFRTLRTKLNRVKAIRVMQELKDYVGRGK